jgi:hypothetical protein
MPPNRGKRCGRLPVLEDHQMTAKQIRAKQYREKDKKAADDVSITAARSTSSY